MRSAASDVRFLPLTLIADEIKTWADRFADLRPQRQVAISVDAK